MTRAPRILAVLPLAALWLALCGFLAPLPAHARETASDRAARWQELSRHLFPGQPLADGTASLSLDAPIRAEDAALVPVTIHIAPGTRVAALWLVIDDNPSPMAAHVRFGPAAIASEIGLRVRVDQYTDMHAVAQLQDGRLVAVRRFIKAAGGCSAPAGTSVEAALQGVGQMRLHRLGQQNGIDQVELLIRHPNFNGMQMDQVSRLYTPARYIDRIEIRTGTESVLALDTDISLATNPAIRFAFRPAPAQELSVVAADTSGAHFSHVFTLASPGA